MSCMDGNCFIVFTVVLSVLAVAAIFLICCCAILCVCCATQALQLCACLVGGSIYTLFRLNNPNSSERTYEMISQDGTTTVTNSEHVIHNAAVTEAYWVAPLAAACVDETDSESVLHNPNVPTANGNPAAIVYQDKWASLLFIITILFITYNCGIAITGSYFAVKESSPQTYFSLGDPPNDFMWYLMVTILMGIISIIMGTICFTVLISYSSFLIRGVQLIIVLFWVCCTVISALYATSWVPTSVTAAIAALSYFYFRSVRRRIPFASAVLSTASAAITKNLTGVMVMSICMQFLQVIWLIISITVILNGWANTNHLFSSETSSLTASQTPISTNSVLVNQYRFLLQPIPHDDRDNTSNGTQSSSEETNYLFVILSTFIIFGIYWGVQVIKGIIQTTVSGTVGCWWFQPHREAAVRGSLFRSVTTSFGSICFGSLLVAAVQSLHAILRTINSQHRRITNRNRNLANEFCVCCLGRLLEWVEQALLYFNKYAFCYVAAYGTSFIESGRRVTELFERRGWTALINDNLIGNALLVVVFLFAVFMAGIGAMSSSLLLPTEQSPTPFALIGAGMGTGIGLMVVNALDGGVAMVFVCFAEDPWALQRNHPVEYNELASAWASITPGYPVPPPAIAIGGTATAATSEPGRSFASTGVYPYHASSFSGVVPHHGLDGNAVVGGSIYTTGDSGFEMRPSVTPDKKVEVYHQSDLSYRANYYDSAVRSGSGQYTEIPSPVSMVPTPSAPPLHSL